MTEKPAQSKRDRAVELAKAFRELPDGDAKALIEMDYILSSGENLERSIEGLTDAMMADLECAIGMEASGL